MVRSLRNKLGLALMVISSHVIPLQAKAQDCSLDPRNTNAEIGMYNAFKRNLNILECGTVNTYDPTLGFIQVYYDVGAEEQNDVGSRVNPCLSGRATGLYGLGDEQPLSQEVKSVFAENGVYFLELSNSPSINQADSLTLRFLEQYSSCPIVSVLDRNQNLESKLSVGPNPFNSLLTVSFALREDSDVGLDIYDLQGRNIYRLINGIRNAGTSHDQYNTDKLEPGVYLLRFRTGKNHNSVTKKIVKTN